jgi:menaquinone-dependent protoporphyrinogen oxidase
MTDKILICYGTRYGSTSEVVNAMATAAMELGRSVDVVNLKDASPPSDISEYDLVVIGSGIRAGQWTDEPIRFMKNNLAALTQRKVALFVVCGYAASDDKCDQAQIDYLDSIAKDVGLTPTSTGLFGGVFDMKKYNFVIRKLVKSIIQKEIPPGEEVPEKIDYRDWGQIKQWMTELLEY